MLRAKECLATNSSRPGKKMSSEWASFGTLFETFLIATIHTGE